MVLSADHSLNKAHSVRLLRYNNTYVLRTEKLTSQHATNVSDVGLKHRDTLIGNRSSGKVYLRYTLEDRVDYVGVSHKNCRVQAINGR